ncbi:unnamed protein product [Symbiodinium sp. CCMP2592]|nr:unnamed protein product [Symbiodinium sp. CCMP2592]
MGSKSARSKAKAKTKKDRKGESTVGKKDEVDVKPALRTADRAKFTDSPFDLSAFISDVAERLGCERNPSAGMLKLATLCSGFGAPRLVLDALLGSECVDEIAACEINEDAVHALLKNQPRPKQPGVLLRDVRALDAHGKSFDFMSSQTGSFPDHRADLLVAGCPCQANSMLNRVIAKVLPRTFVLEGRPADDEIRKALGHDYVFVSMVVGSSPVVRDRVWTVGIHKDVSESMVNVEADVRKAMDVPKLTHSATTFMLESVPAGLPSRDRPDRHDAVLAAAEAHRYAECFKTALSKATKAKRLPKNFRVPQLDERHSINVKEGTAWMRAQVDVCRGCERYGCIASHLMKTSGIQKEPLADVGQTCGRGAVHVAGSVPTVTTSTRLWSFKRDRSLAMMGESAVLIDSLHFF